MQVVAPGMPGHAEEGVQVTMSRVFNQAIAGVIVVAIGVLLLIGTLDVVDLGTVARWIPSLFILLGLWRLVASGFTNVLGPFIIIVVAALVQLAVLGVDIGQWWPVLLIIIGVGMLVGWQRVRGVGHQNASTNTVNAVGIFGGPTLRVTSQGFKGGQVTAFMGGVDLPARGQGTRPASRHRCHRHLRRG